MTGAGTPAERWGVFSGWNYEVHPITRETAQCVFYFDLRERRAYQEKVVAILPDRPAAEKLAARLTSASNVAKARRNDANIWFVKESAKLIANATGAAS